MISSISWMNSTWYHKNIAPYDFTECAWNHSEIIRNEIIVVRNRMGRFWISRLMNSIWFRWYHQPPAQLRWLRSAACSSSPMAFSVFSHVCSVVLGEKGSRVITRLRFYSFFFLVPRSPHPLSNKSYLLTYLHGWASRQGRLSNDIAQHHTPYETVQTLSSQLCVAQTFLV